MLEGGGEGGPDLAALESVLQLQMFPFMRGVGVGCSPSMGGCYPVFGGEYLHPHLFCLELLSLGVKICNLDLCAVLNFLGPRGPLVEPSISPPLSYRPPVHPSRPAPIFPEFLDEL